MFLLTMYGIDNIEIEQKFCLHLILINDHQGRLVYTDSLSKSLLIL